MRLSPGNKAKWVAFNSSRFTTSFSFDLIFMICLATRKLLIQVDLVKFLS